MHTRLLSVALAALLPLASHAAQPSRAVLLVQTYDNQPSDDPLEYIPVWLGKDVARESTLPKALLGQPLQVFNAGASTGNVRLAACGLRLAACGTDGGRQQHVRRHREAAS